MSLTKDDLIQSVSETSGIKKKKSRELVDSVLDLIKSGLAAGEDIMISGFGKFKVKEKGARQGRNPHTGERLMLNARRVLTFTPSGVLRRKING